MEVAALVKCGRGRHGSHHGTHTEDKAAGTRTRDEEPPQYVVS